MIQEKKSTREEVAAERAALLEEITQEQISRYRDRRNRQGDIIVRKEVFDYVRQLCNDESDDESYRDGCILLLAAGEYAQTGEVPDFVDTSTGEINKALRRIFNGFIRPRLDESFDNYCITCLKNERKGQTGATEAKIRKLMVQEIGETYGGRAGVSTMQLIQNNKSAWERVAKLNGGAETARALLEKARENAIAKLQNESV